MNAKGQPRSRTDHLSWHRAAHTVDLFAYQCGPIVKANAIEGPHHPELGIAMDRSIQLKAESGAICTLSLSFNNDGPLGTFFRYIGDNGFQESLQNASCPGRLSRRSSFPSVGSFERQYCDHASRTSRRFLSASPRR